MKRYHPGLVALHWVLAFMIIMGLIMGGNVLSATPNETPEKILYLKIHMSMGIIILVLMLVRFVVRITTHKPPAADIGSPMLNRLGTLTHYLLYVVVILLAASGIATAGMAGLPEILFGGSGAVLPNSFDEFPPRIAHGVLALVLSLLLAGHVGASLYHQFVRKDGLFSRMWFGRRT